MLLKTALNNNQTQQRWRNNIKQWDKTDTWYSDTRLHVNIKFNDNQIFFCSLSFCLLFRSVLLICLPVSVTLMSCLSLRFFIDVSVCSSALHLLFIPVCFRWTRLDCVGWPRGCHLDREPEFGTWWQPHTDAGQRGPHPHGTHLQNRFRATQHRQRFTRHRVTQWHGVHELLRARVEPDPRGEGLAFHHTAIPYHNTI